MKHSDAKLFFSILIASFLLTIFCMVAMANSSLRIIYFGMRHDVSMLSIGSQISSLLQKLICGAVLLTSGIFCIYLYLQTYESEHFLQISAIFFLSAGLIMSLQDYKVLFYATSPDRKLLTSAPTYSCCFSPVLSSASGWTYLCLPICELGKPHSSPYIWRCACFGCL